MRKFLILVFAILLVYSVLPALISEYTFNSSVGTYTPITDGTVHGTATNDDHSFNAIPIGFDFVFDQNVISAISINSNGFMVFGPTAQSSAVSLSNANANASNRVCAALNRDLKSKTVGMLMSKLIGEAPNRIFVMQWANYQRFGVANAGDTLNFQVRIHEGTNVIEIQYGHIVFGNSNLTSNTFQVGLRGNSSAEFNNRSVVIGTNDWLTSVVGTVNTATCAMSPTFVPTAGLTYSFTPLPIGDAPNPAIVGTPVNNGVDVLQNAHLIWSDGGGGPSGYKLYLGTDNPPTDLVDGTTLGLITNYTPATLFAYGTVYYWKVVPYNQFGDAANCPIWSFTTLTDPSIVTFPYSEGFEGAYYPPLGWTTTGWVRGNEAHSGTYCARNLYTPAGTRILMTPRIALPAEKTLKFWWRDSDIAKVANHDTTYCEISVNGGVDWSVLAILSTASVELAYHQRVIDLATYAGENVYLRWRDVTDGTTSAFGVGLDDISIYSFVAVYNPPTNLTQVSGNNTVALTWQAPTIAPDMTVGGYKVYRNATELATVASNLLTYADNTAINGTTYSYYVTALYINPSGESVPSNTVEGTPLAPLFDPPTNLVATQTAWNAATLSWLLPGETPPGITEGFEGTFPPAGWTQTITNTGAVNTMGVLPTWCQFGNVALTPAVPPHSGLKQVGLWWAYDHQDEWLMTPQFLCPAASNLTFWSYCNQGSPNADHYYVKVSTNGGTNWTTLWDASTLPVLANAYTTPYSISLSAYAGQNIKLAWHAIDGPTMDGLWFVWFIDQVAVTSGKNVISFSADDFTVKSAASPSTISPMSYRTGDRLTRDGNTLPLAPLPDRSRTGIKVYRNNTLLQTIADANAHQYVDATLVPGTYVYKVTCYYTSPNGESIYSNESSVTVAPYVFNPPTNFTAVPGNASIVMHWAAPTSGLPSGYKVFINGTVGPTLPATTLTYTATGLINGTAYEVWVTAVYTNPSGESVSTTHLTVTPVAPPLNPPTNLTGTVAGSAIHLAWNAPAPVSSGKIVTNGKTLVTDRSLTGYRVYQNNHVIMDIMNPTVTIYDVLNLANGTYNFKVTALYTETPGESAPSNTVTIVGNQDPVMPSVTALIGNYPNPFNPSTVLSYSVSKAGFVSLDIYNSLGQKVKTLVNSKMNAGNYSVNWNGTDDKGNALGSGLYFYKMKSGNYSSTKKMILLK